MERTGWSAALLALAAAVSAGASQAQTLTQRKPGLWEVQHTQQAGQVAGQAMPSQRELETALGRMTAEQRRQVEQTMRERGVGLTGKPGTMRYCLTQAMVERDPLSQPPDPSMKCEHSVQPKSATEASFSFSCTSPQGTLKGQGRGWNITPEGYRTSLAMEGTMNGQPMSMKMEQNARWLGSDCKGIKPLAQ
ncbi:DUF3617 domain-containing protein [Aquabacterium sp. A7-Y]|uniref:DUF3617 domain-containing protein n=1 Tax=Aquabacterium sp. A7-Y TaxID=1349605 RepID=UPI00223D3A87|nr:DUF3617 domain-containing protein [Aquabacterium sp. A7-Y]MCW7538868.1 DUF3617 domain-containing protein [Aquabacterium sp. A7-Y]